MSNGETSETNAVNNGTSDYTIITPEAALQVVIAARDTYKGDAERLERELVSVNKELVSAQRFIENVRDVVESIIEDESLDDSFTRVDTDLLKQLCELVSIELTKEIEVEFDIRVSLTLTVPRGADEDEFTMCDPDSFCDIDLRVSESNSDYEITSQSWETR